MTGSSNHPCPGALHILHYLSSAELRDEMPSSLGPAAPSSSAAVATVATGLRRMQRGLGIRDCRALLRLADGGGAIVDVLGEVEAVGGGEDVGEGARAAEGRLQRGKGESLIGLRTF